MTELLPREESVGCLTAPEEELRRQVADALARVHDLPYLQTHPLLEWATPAAGTPAGRALQRDLLEAVEALRSRPRAGAARADERLERLLELRYVEGLEPARVAAELAVGRSEYYRQQARAVQAVASLLRERWGLGSAPRPGQPRALAPHRSTTTGLLPRPLSSFVGRERELVELARLVEHARLVTLTGPPGTGKTRLAIGVAEAIGPGLAGGAAFVPLAPIADPSLVVSAIAQAVGLRAGATLDELTGHLRDRRLLLLLDNFEHVMAAAPAVGELLVACRRLTVVATSRVALAVQGEHNYPVLPLGVPAGGRTAPEELARHEATRLFVDRARAAAGGFDPDAAEAAAVAEICRRLDGLPLAIELAATCVRLMPPSAILARLGDVLALPAGGPRDAPARHRTLPAAIGWSYDLLGEEGRRLFRRLGVFAGGWTLESAEALCSLGAGESAPVLPGMAALLDASLVTQRDGRYGMLETLRDHARERLVAGGELEAARRRHAEQFLGLAEEAEPRLRGHGQVAWLHRLEREHDNLRAALAWLVDRQETERGLRLAGALHFFWYLRGYFAEGGAWLDKVLALPGAAARTAWRAKALEASGLLAIARCEYPAAQCRLEESVALAREVGDAGVEVRVLVHMAQLLYTRGDLAAARSGAEESLALAERLGDTWAIGHSLYWLGDVALAEGKYGEARTHLEAAEAVKREGGLTAGVGVAVRLQGVIAYRLGEYTRARALIVEGLVAVHEAAHTNGVVYSLGACAGLAVAQGQLARAARLFGTAAAGREAFGHPRPSIDGLFGADIAATRAALGERVYETAWAEGRAMTLHQAVDYALDDGAT
jgi:predicted ATPase